MEASIIQILTVSFLQPADHCGFSAFGTQQYTHIHTPRTNIKVEINALKYLAIVEFETFAFQYRVQEIQKVQFIFSAQSPALLRASRVFLIYSKKAIIICKHASRSTNDNILHVTSEDEKACFTTFKYFMVAYFSVLSNS